MPLAILALSALLLAVVGCHREPPAAAEAADRADTVAQSPRGKDPDHPIVSIETSLGTMTVRLDAVHAPGTVQNFLNYVSDDFYSNTLFHYVAPDKMILGGGYTTDAELKPAGFRIRNEANSELKNVRGTIAMARNAAEGIDSATSQFFINLVDSPSFDHRGDSAEDYGYCVFGEVTDGLDVATKISHSPTRNGGGDLEQTPDPPVVIKSMRIVR